MYKNRIYFRRKRYVIAGFIFGLLILSILFQNYSLDQKTASKTKSANYYDTVSNIERIKNQDIFYNYTTSEWLTNGNFTGGVIPWDNETVGDKTDVNATYSNGAANYEVLGNSGKFSLIVDPKNTTEMAKWTASKMSIYKVLPDYYSKSFKGFNASHQWQESGSGEQDNNTAGVIWTRAVTMPINMSDYEITSASIKATFNATVQRGDLDSGGIEVPGDDTSGGQDDTWDYAYFSVEIASLQTPDIKYELAHNHTGLLGSGDTAGFVSYTDTLMTNNVNQDLLKALLKSVLSSDNFNFIVILGIDIYCADNDASYDFDNFRSLLIRSLNLTFTYQKIMNQYTTLSWSQEGNEIPTGGNIAIENAILNFSYKVDKDWDTYTSSPNSELKMIINNNIHSETLKISNFGTSYQKASYDITNIVKATGKGVNIELSIQLSLADRFLLDQPIILSIDNASLQITYSVASSEILTSSKLYLNKQDKTQSKYLQISKGETVNITVKYYNTSNGVFLDADSVNLTGYGTPKELYKDSIRQQYNITINTTSLAYGENYFKVTAIKSFYETQEISFTLDIVKRDTYLEVYVDNINVNSTSIYETTIGKYLNITAYYRDSITNNTIIGANLQFIDVDVGTPEAFTPHPLNLNLYNITKFADNIGKGISFIQITGEKTNYTKASLDFSIFVEERDTDLEVFINGTTPPAKYIIELEETINITANFTDGITHNFIPDAIVSLIGYDNLTKTGNLYNITLSGLDLKQQGINFLTIYAYKENYKVQSYTLVVEVVERQTNLHIFFDGVNVTVDPSTTLLPIGKIVTISTKYFDKYNNSIIGANIRIIQDTTIYQLVEDPSTHIFSTTINTLGLGIGITVPYIIAERVNYQTKTENLRIQVRKINTLITTDDEEDTITVKPGEKVNLKIEVRDLDFGGKISECEVTYDWKYGDGELDEEESGVYEFSLENVPEGTHKITITVYKEGGLYDFQEYEITINVVREEGESLLYMILFIAAMVGAGGLASYFVAYYYVLKYPKPVRKVRKYRRSLKRKKGPKTEITSKEKAINELYKNRSPSMTSFFKAKSIEKIPPSIDKIIKKSIEKPTK